MSTPSTATATLPAGHQYYSRHQAYQQPAYAVNSTLVNGAPRLGGSQYNSYSAASSAAPNNSNDLRRTAAVNSRQSNQLPPIRDRPSPEMAAQNGRRSDRKPDWAEFYKNGVPKEVILIDDDDDSDPKVVSNPHANSTNGTTFDRHADKKRKTAASSTYDPVYNPQPSYSTTQTPYYENSSANTTVSTDRTAPVFKTTASSSLETSVRNGYLPPPLEDGVVGQKRKRTRNVTAEEVKAAKRRELERVQSPYSAYIPPPNPPLKSKEIHVQVIKDTSKDANVKCDDDDGHYIVNAEAPLTDRYQIVKLLGQGTFGKVVEAYDRRTRDKVAIKIIRAVQKYRDASRIELRVLNTLAQNDKHNRNKCIHLRHCFDWRNHVCIVTDLYGQSVFDFLKGNNFTPFPSSHIQLFARQLLTSVAFLHDLNLIHTDLKPENILLVDNSYQTFTYNRTIPSSTTTSNRSSRHRKVLLNPEIRLIDFGSATFDDEYHSSVVSTRHYRAPEIILNLGWSFACDMWSIGCILVEFFTGDALFQTHDNLEHLAMMEPVCNAKLDKELITRVLAKDRTSKNPAASYFTRTKRLDYPNADTPRNSRKYVKAMKKLQETIPPNTDFNRQFLDLLKKIFVYDPSKRITAKQALRHPWFKESLKDDGTEAARIRDEKAKKQARILDEQRGRERDRDY